MNYLEMLDMPVYAATQESLKLLEELKSNSIRFAHWKSNSHLSKALAGGTDLDLLIYPEDKDSFEASLTKLGYKKIISQPWCTYPDVDDWLGLDYTTGSFLHIHAHYALVTGIQHVKHLYLPWMEEFFRHVIIDEHTGWPIPKYELEALILFIRIWAKMPPNERLKNHPIIPSFIQAELISLLKRANVEELISLCSELNLNIPENFVSRIQSIVDKSDPDDILEVSIFFYKQLKPYFRFPWFVSSIKSSFYKNTLKIKKKFARLLGPSKFGKTIQKGGKVIALIGSDGSGKSTLSKDLIDWLSYKLDTHYFYMGKRPYIRSYSKVMFSSTDFLFSGNKVARYFKKLAGNLYYVLLVSKKLRLLRLAQSMSSSGSVIICDRFPQKDIFGINDGPYLQNSGGKISSQLEMNLFDRISEVEADIVIRLQVTPEVASERKPEHDKEVIKQKCKNIGRITFKHAHVVDVDSGVPYDQVLLTIKRVIWKLL